MSRSLLLTWVVYVVFLVILITFFFNHTLLDNIIASFLQSLSSNSKEQGQNSLRLFLVACLSLFIGNALVSLGVYFVERNVRPKNVFTPTASRFDTGKFLGRFYQMLFISDPSTLLVSDAEIKRHVTNISNWKPKNKGSQDLDALENGGSVVRNGNSTVHHLNGKVRSNVGTKPRNYTNANDAQLDETTQPLMPEDDCQEAKYWYSKKIVDAAVHPDTKEIVPRPFRMSGYLPFNGPVCVLLASSKAMIPFLFWSFMNQSQAALVNFFNRNATNAISTSTLTKSYVMAVSAALFSSIGAIQLLRAMFSEETVAMLMKFVPVPTNGFAGMINCFLMRKDELKSGITLMDVHGNILFGGKTSRKAAERAVRETMFSRAVLPIPCFFIPAVLQSLPFIKSMSSTSPEADLFITTLLMVLSFGYGLPVTLALFPQQGKIAIKDLEKEFRVRADQNDVVYYNKGL